MTTPTDQAPIGIKQRLPRARRDVGVGRMGELQMSHPYLTKRIESLRLFAASALYRGSQGLDGGLTREELEARTTDLIKVI